MASPNTTISEMAVFALDNYSTTLADNVSNNTALLAKLKSREGGIRTFDGGKQIDESLEYLANGNAGYYSGGEALPIQQYEHATQAMFAIKQASVQIVWTGLDEIMNSGAAKIIDFVKSKIRNGEKSMANLIGGDIYSDGTGYGGKQITGLGAAIPTDPTTGTYGSINRANWSFWRPKINANPGTLTAGTILSEMTDLYAKCTRGSDSPDLIPVDNNLWVTIQSVASTFLRFTKTDTPMAKLGFATIQFFNAEIVLDGGIGGSCPANTGFFLNTNYLHWRPFAGRNMVPLKGDRQPVNSDTTVNLVVFAGNLTCSGQEFQGILKGY